MEKYYPPDILPPSLWGSAPMERSPELTVVYLVHVQGLRRQRFAITYHDDWELIAVRSGTSRLSIDHVIELTPGTLYLMPPGIGHREYELTAIDMFWIGLRGYRLDYLPLKGRHIQAEALFTDILALEEILRRNEPYTGPELDAQAMLLFTRFWRFLPEEASPTPLDRALAYLQSHYTQHLDLPTLAARHGISEGHFYRAFKRRTGKTPLQYLTDLRMRDACHWLRHSDLTITQIALRCGYSDANYFTRVFRQTYGQSPRAFRRP